MEFIVMATSVHSYEEQAVQSAKLTIIMSACSANIRSQRLDHHQSDTRQTLYVANFRIKQKFIHAVKNNSLQASDLKMAWWHSGIAHHNSSSAPRKQRTLKNIYQDGDPGGFQTDAVSLNGYTITYLMGRSLLTVKNIQGGHLSE